MTRWWVLVGMSGGVDSSVAAALLLEQGHAVHGVTMRIWSGTAQARGRQTDAAAAGGGHGCYGPAEAEEIAAARAVAAQLGIPHTVIDLRDAYRAHVLDPFCRDYRAGRTPNPCVRCNPRIKFGVLLEEARASGISFERYATGHYARLTPGPDGMWQLRKARDRAKDQSYFLYALTAEQLAATLFPLGELRKADVRRLAMARGLTPGVGPHESQDFMDGQHATLFDPPPAPGPILDREGRHLGEHRGIVHYTIGQRRGLGIAARHPLYVTAIDAARNAIIVGPRSDLLHRRLVAEELCWIAGRAPRLPRRVRARIRYRHREADAELRRLADPTPVDDRLLLEFRELQPAITPGQAVVFYDGDDPELVLGGGTIHAAL